MCMGQTFSSAWVTNSAGDLHFLGPRGALDLALSLGAPLGPGSLPGAGWKPRQKRQAGRNSPSQVCILGPPHPRPHGKSKAWLLALSLLGKGHEPQKE